MPKCTDAQNHALNILQHILVLNTLPDGDMLVADKDAATDQRGVVIHEFGPYILTRDGALQSVPYHYHHYHDRPIPCAGAYMPQHDESRPVTLGDMIEEEK